MSDIFLSYAREDRAQVGPLVEALQQAGFSVWWDDNLDPGAHFDKVLEQELKSAACVVVAWSIDAIKSDWVRSEAHYGFDRGILVPVMLDAVMPPLPFSLMQAANLKGWPESRATANEFDKLVAAIGRQVGSAMSERARPAAAKLQGVMDIRTAVAVLPLINRSSDPDDEYLADGITEDIITRLQRFRTFPIISRHSVYAYKGQEYDLPRIARELNVAYLVVGQMRKSGKRIRVTVELIETRNFHTDWSEKFDREIVDIFDLQDEISLIIAAMLEPEIERAEREQALPTRTESIASWHLVRRGLWHQYKLTREDAIEARRFFTLALEQDPNSVEALVQMAWWHWWDLSVRRGTAEDWAVVEEYAKKASAIDPKDARPRLQLGIATMMSGDPQSSIRIFQDAIDLTPCFATAYNSLGSAYEVTGQPEKALQALDTVLQLSPFDYSVFHTQGERACAFYCLQDYEQAVDAADLSLALRPGYWLAHLIRAVALQKAGQQEAAERAVGRLMRFRPKFSERDIQWIGYTDPARIEDLVHTLKAAGWAPGAS
jgi:TolB-like protein/Tfp pilus assembly protein PilF